MLMIGLRTILGLDLGVLKTKFDADIMDQFYQDIYETENRRWNFMDRK